MKKKDEDKHINHASIHLGVRQEELKKIINKNREELDDLNTISKIVLKIVKKYIKRRDWRALESFTDGLLASSIRLIPPSIRPQKISQAIDTTEKTENLLQSFQNQEKKR